MAERSAMASRRGLVLTLLGVILLALGAWRLGWLVPVPPPPPAAPRPSPPPSFQSAWATEADWIVDVIVRDVRTTAVFARTGTLPGEPAPAVRARDLSLEPHVFSPAPYLEVAEKALAGARPKAPSASAAGEGEQLLAALLDLRPLALVHAAEKVSRRLEKEPLDPDAHEQAALILGAFALREGAGFYTDPRPALCRMTAHLTLARAVGRAPADRSTAGGFAFALLETLVGRERDALARLEALEGTARSRADRAWLRALRLRNTGDWRIAESAGQLTLLEKMEEFRSLARARDDLVALDWLERQGTPEPIPDWGRIALDSGGSVETHNRFAPVAPGAEMTEATEVWAALGRAPFQDMDAFLEALNVRPGPSFARDGAGPLRSEVLGWGLWADRAQRHLIDALATESYRLGSMLGQSGASRAFVENARVFSRLDLFALFLRNVAVDAKGYGPAMAAARELALHAPERMTGGAWWMLREKEDYAPVPTDLPDAKAWFHPTLPPGTVLDFSGRKELGGFGPERLREMRLLAPYDARLARFAADRLPGGHRTLADLVALYGPLGEYNLYVMGKLADASWYDPPEFRRRQGALCEIDRYRCFLLGYRLAELGFPDEAAVAYQKGFDETRDRVAASNQAEWLVQYYFEKGETARAEKVARRAADTGSGNGLFVLARLLERTGRLDKAERHYRQIFEVYNDPGDMTGFYYRQARVAGKAVYESRLRDALALALPSGLEPLDRKILPPKPTDGVVVKKENDNTKRCGIKWGNVIVGLDGFRVHDLKSFYVVKALSYSPHMKLVVWRGQGYDDVEAELWDRRFRVDLEDLAPKK
jgi:tetratricopeptide (TPR) repeat protein